MAACVSWVWAVGAWGCIWRAWVSFVVGCGCMWVVCGERDGFEGWMGAMEWLWGCASYIRSCGMRGLHYGNSLCFGGSSIEAAVIRKNIYVRENFISEGWIHITVQYTDPHFQSWMFLLSNLTLSRTIFILQPFPQLPNSPCLSYMRMQILNTNPKDHKHKRKKKSLYLTKPQAILIVHSPHKTPTPLEILMLLWPL